MQTTISPEVTPSAEGTPLLGAPDKPQVEWRRWYILGVFSLLAMTQCIVWFTFSSVPTYYKDFFGISTVTIDLLLNWGPIAFIPVAPFVSWLLSRPKGLRSTIFLGVVLVAIGAVVRVVPCVVPAESRHRWVPLLHVGQIFNAAAGPIVMSPVSQLSSTWFPNSERTTATAIAFLANTGGMSVGFLLGPAAVHSAAEAPNLIYIEAALGVIPLILFLCHFPNEPRHPPSAAAASRRTPTATATAIADPTAVNTVASDVNGISPSEAELKPKQEQLSFLSGLLRCLRNPSLVLIVVAAGMQSGVYSSWAGTLQQVLEPLGYTPSQAGWLGFAATCAGLVGGLLSGRIADRWFPRRMKAMLVVLFGLCITCFVWFSLSLPSKLLPKPVIPSTIVTIVISVTLGGLFQGSLDPLYYELAAEGSFPVPEGTTASEITVLWNVATLVTLFAAPHVAVSLYNIVLLVTMAACFLLTLFIRERYLRKDMEHSAKSPALPEQP